MPRFLESLLFLVAFLVSARGTGALVLKKVLPDEPPGYAFATAFGFGLWLVFGGILNLAQLALPMVLDLVLLFGLASSAISAAAWYKARSDEKAGRSLKISGAQVLQKFWLPLSVILLVGYLVSSQMPSLSLNLHDDFFAYLPRPIRMLSTGSVGGNPFDVLGLDSYGGQTFLQSFFVPHLSLLHVHGFDAIACFGLCLGLLLEIGNRFRISSGIILASFVAFLLIPPQIVNTSALFSGSLMILGLFFTFLLTAESFGQKDSAKAKAGVILGAVFLSSLSALKNPFVPFGLLFVFIFALRLVLLNPDKKQLLQRIGMMLALTAVLLGPWIFMALPQYRRAFQAASAPVSSSMDPGNHREDLVANFRAAFSFQDSPWGGPVGVYGLLVIFLLVIGIWSWRQTKYVEAAQRAQVATISAVCFSAALSYLANLYLFDPMNGIRYALPILIPAVAIAILAFSWLLPAKKDDPRQALRIGALVSLATALFLTLGFGGANLERFDRVFRQRTLLSFPLAGTKPYRQYILTSVGAQAASYIDHIQAQFAPGTTVLAWIRTPFLLDQNRNRIYHVNESSVITPWLADFPLEGNAQDIRGYLRQYGVRYVFFEHDAPGAKTDAEFAGWLNSPHSVLRRFGQRNIALRRALKTLADHSETLYKTPDTVVFDMEKAIEPADVEQGAK